MLISNKKTVEIHSAIAPPTDLHSFTGAVGADVWGYFADIHRAVRDNTSGLVFLGASLTICQLKVKKVHYFDPCAQQSKTGLKLKSKD